MNRRLCHWYLLAGLLVVATACSSADADLAASAVTIPQTTVASESAPPADGGDAATEPQTLEDYLGAGAARILGTGNGQAQGADEEALEQQRLVQQEIQVCMQAQGFTYVPEAVGDGAGFFLAAQSEGVSAQDYAATEGFGISTRFDAVLEGELEVTDDIDPNDEHLATLSEGAAEAWQLALQGQPPERNDEGQLIDPETGEVVQGGRGQPTGGCRGQAQLEVRGDFTALVELEDELAALADRIDSDPRVTEIRRDWVDCMAEAGFDYADESEARADINAQTRPLQRSFFASGDAGDDAQPQGGRGQGQGGGNQLQAIAGLELTPDQEMELDALQDLERALAVASLACQGDTAVEVAAISLRYQEEFVDANRSTLESLGS